MSIDHYVGEFQKLCRATNVQQFLSALYRGFWKYDPGTKRDLIEIFVFVKGRLLAGSAEEELCRKLIDVLERHPSESVYALWFLTRALEIRGVGSQSATLAEEFIGEVRQEILGQIGLVVSALVVTQSHGCQKRHTTGSSFWRKATLIALAPVTGGGSLLGLALED